MHDYKKSYKGFVIWLLLFIVAFFSTVFIPSKNDNLLTLVTGNIMTVGVAVLAGIICLNEKIYWYNGIDYEDAAKATSEQRRAYAFKHFKKFGSFAAVYFLYSVVSYIVNLSMLVNIMVAGFGIVVVAFSTINIKLEVKKT